MLNALLDCLISLFRSSNISPECIDRDMVNYALFEHRLYTDDFDGLDLKSNGIMQFVGIVLGLSAFQITTTGNVSWLRIASLASFAVALVFAIASWWVRGARSLPNAESVRHRLRDKGPAITEKELIRQIDISSQKLRELCLAKGKYLALSFASLLLGVVLLIMSLAIR